MTDIKTVTTQEELDEALAAGIIDLLIDRPDGATPLDIENKKVRLWDNSSAILWGNSSAILWDNASAILKKFTVAWKKSVDATITGTGHVIDMTAIDLSNPGEWVEYVGASVDEEGQVHLYKAVDDNLESAYSRGKFVYKIGSIVQPETWSQNNMCGNGIHLCPSPQHARDHFPGATRFLEVTCDDATFIPIDTSKIKTAQAYVLREVDICGTPLKEDK